MLRVPYLVLVAVSFSARLDFNCYEILIVQEGKVMAFKVQPITASTIATGGYDWDNVAKRVAEEIGASDYRVSFLFGSSRPSSALNPLAAQRALFAFEKLGTGGAMPVLSFFGTRKTWVDVAEAVIRALGYDSSDGWGSVLDENDNPIRVLAHNDSKLCFAINVYAPTRSDVESRSADGSSGSESPAADGDGNGNEDIELDFSD